MIGRPRQYDKNKALEAAMAVFWANGYQGTSYSALSEAMQMNKPSIYGAFGDKEELFLRVIDRCAEDYARPAFELLHKGKNCRDSFEMFLSAMINNALIKTHPGCLINTVLGEASSFSPKFQQKLKVLINEGDELIGIRLQQAVEEGELTTSLNVNALSKMLNNLVIGFAIRARAGESKQSLHQFATETLKLIFK
jgi:TetR/AcrR family transcriptional regulator, copper-responsive repressor